MSLEKIKTNNEKYKDQLLFISSIAVPAFVFHGTQIIYLLLAVFSSALLTDIICMALQKKKYTFIDASIYVYIMAYTFMLPSNFPIPMAIFGVVLMVVLGRHLFGGRTNIIFSPPAVAVAFLTLAYPTQMLSYPKTDELFPFFTSFSGELEKGIENTLALGSIPPIEPLDLLMGNFTGSIGTTYILVIAVCALSLIIRRSVSFVTLASFVLSFSSIAMLFPRAGEGMTSAIFELCAGNVLFGLVFLANDPQLLPKTYTGKALFGVILGLMTMSFKIFTRAEGTFLYALLITNAICINIDAFVEAVSNWLRFYLASFENLRMQTQNKTITKLADTQEIELPSKLKYDMPEVNNEIIHIDFEDVDAKASEENFERAGEQTEE